jgi:hypothetical protein
MERFSKTKERLKPMTQKFYRDWYNRFFLYFDTTTSVSSITQEVAKQFIDCCNDYLSPCTVHR